ncbi:NUDIX hydrolase [Arthrobacter sp. ERGS1:01]|uniref:NUDIX hydrolase n=1 Tax=Arthrobacter sp. ERGS1:01 TaxID=1704044 RepID=UPI0006B5FCC2|nr:CoA pyrophosphatase [Arthrobacter sp. ERGS1:01]ALE07260.1 NUDIX hydrolase [Arthrobacter sp. ERGS1:01]
MSAYEDLAGLARRAAHDAFRLGRPAMWDTPLDRNSARQAAVLLLFGTLDGSPAPAGVPLVPADLDMLFLERATTLSAHPGQVAFPGGGVDPGDASIIAAALREAKEETGLEPDGVEILGVLPEVPMPVSNFIVTPVIGWWTRQTPVAVVDYGESAQVFRVPVRELLDPANRFTAALNRGGRSYRGPSFLVNGVVVWGFTAGILDHVFEELGWTVPWDVSREIPAPI